MSTTRTPCVPLPTATRAAEAGRRVSRGGGEPFRLPDERGIPLWIGARVVAAAARHGCLRLFLLRQALRVRVLGGELPRPRRSARAASHVRPVGVAPSALPRAVDQARTRGHRSTRFGIQPGSCPACSRLPRAQLSLAIGVDGFAERGRRDDAQSATTRFSAHASFAMFSGATARPASRPS